MEAERLWERAREGSGRPCSHDRDCVSPLRCSRDLSCIAPPAMTGEVGEDGPMVLCYGRLEEALFHVELAVDADQRQRGLMHRPWQLDSWGMLFLYPEEQANLAFWMADTHIPLDMVFLDRDRVIAGVIEDAQPLDRTSRSVNRPSQYVLELNAGQSRRYGLEAGVRCEFLNLPAGTAPPQP